MVKKVEKFVVLILFSFFSFLFSSKNTNAASLNVVKVNGGKVEMQNGVVSNKPVNDLTVADFTY